MKVCILEKIRPFRIFPWSDAFVWIVIHTRVSISSIYRSNMHCQTLIYYCLFICLGLIFAVCMMQKWFFINFVCTHCRMGWRGARNASGRSCSITSNMQTSFIYLAIIFVFFLVLNIIQRLQLLVVKVWYATFCSISGLKLDYYMI